MSFHVLLRDDDPVGLMLGILIKERIIRGNCINMLGKNNLIQFFCEYNKKKNNLEQIIPTFQNWQDNRLGRRKNKRKLWFQNQDKNTYKKNWEPNWKKWIELWIENKNATSGNSKSNL